MKYAWLVLAIFAARFLAFAIAFPQGDGDLRWQRWLGGTILARHAIPRALGMETFSAPGAPWTPQEWAFSLVAARAAGGIAWTIFAGGVAAAALVALAIVAFAAVRRGASPRAVALCTALAGVALLTSFGVRVQVVAWPFLAAFLLAIDGEGATAFWAIPVAVLWSNVHASAIIAPILAGVATFGTLLDQRAFDARVRRSALVAIGSAVAICVNPFGWELPRYAVALFTSPIKLQIQEWRPVDLTQASFAFGALPLLLLLLLFFANSKRRSYRDLAIVALATFLVFSAARNVAIFGLIVMPYVAMALTRGVRLFAPEAAPLDLRAARLARIVMPTVALALAIVVAFVLLHDPKFGREHLGARAIASLRDVPRERRLLCEDFAWCALALEPPRGGTTPHVRIFLDGRADPFPVDVWRDYDRIVAVRHDWREAMRRYDVNTVLVQRGSALDQALDLTRLWHVGYRDPDYVVWLRDERRRSDRRRNEPARIRGVAAIS